MRAIRAYGNRNARFGSKVAQISIQISRDDKARLRTWQRNVINQSDNFDSIADAPHI